MVGLFKLAVLSATYYRSVRLIFHYSYAGSWVFVMTNKAISFAQPNPVVNLIKHSMILVC